MSLDMLLQVLRTLERFPTKIALVRLERDVDSDMRCNMIALDGGCATASPLTGQVEVVSTLAPDMTFTNMLLQKIVQLVLRPKQGVC